MPDVIFNGPDGRLEGRYHQSKKGKKMLNKRVILIFFGSLLGFVCCSHPLKYFYEEGKTALHLACMNGHIAIIFCRMRITQS